MLSNDRKGTAMCRPVSIVALTLLVSCFAVPESASAVPWADAMFPARHHDFGTIARSSKAEYEFKIKNPYNEPMRITSVRSSCGCTIPRVKEGSELLKPHQEGAIVARVNSQSFTGDRGATLTVRVSRPKYPRTPSVEVQLQVKVNIRGDVTVTPGSVQFGQIKQGTAYRQTAKVRCRGGRWSPTLEGVECHHPHLTAELVPLGSSGYGRDYELRVVVDADTPAGYLTDHLTLITSNRRTEPLHVAVEGRVMQALQVSPAPLFLGTLQPGERASKTLVVRADEPFQVTGIRCEDDDLQWTLPSGDTARPVQVIPITFTAGQSPGQVSRKLVIETDLRGLTTTLTAQATIEPSPALAEAEPAADEGSAHHTAKPIVP